MFRAIFHLTSDWRRMGAMLDILFCQRSLLFSRLGLSLNPVEWVTSRLLLSSQALHCRPLPCSPLTVPPIMVLVWTIDMAIPGEFAGPMMRTKVLVGLQWCLFST